MEVLKSATASVPLRCAVLLMSCMGIALPSGAEEGTPWRDTVVIEDRGGVSLKEFIPEKAPSTPNTREKPWEEAGDGIFAPELYPIRTPSMTLGRIGPGEGEGLDTSHLTTPFFLVGYDKTSIKWLQKNQQLLSERFAMGLVINVESPEEMRHLYQITGNKLVLHPVAGDQLAKTLKLKHYPIYIGHQGILR